MTESRSPHAASVAQAMAPALGAAAVLLSAAAILAGCGTTTQVSDHGTLSVALREFRITPQSTEVAAGSLNISVANDGRLTHSLVILNAAGHQLAASRPVAPGQTTTLATSLPAGHYELASGIQGDKADGLYGTLNVG